jgi:hypothetical protein
VHLAPSLLAISSLAIAAATLSSACGGHTVLDTGGSSSGTGGSGGSTGTVACLPQPCAAGELCFHGWAGTCTTMDCSADCPCACAALPDACPMDMPCICPSGGYFGSPGETFGNDAGNPFPGGQVHCYGS